MKNYRINECMKRGNPPPVRKDIDKGRWLQEKVDKLRMSYVMQVKCAVILFWSDQYELCGN